MTSSVEAIGRLRSPAGQEALRWLAEAGFEQDRAITLGSKLRELYPADLAAAALSLTELRALGRSKFSRADQMWFTRAGLEQSSAELVSGHIARRYEGAARIADLCTGIGGNLIMLAGRAPVIAVDADPVHLTMAGLNAEVYGHTNVTLVNDDVRQVPLAGVDAVFVDPARREGQRRLATGRSMPPLDWSLSLADLVPCVAVKVAPGIPADMLPGDWETEFISIGRQLTSGVLWSPAMRTAASRATLLPGGSTLAPSQGPPVPVVEVGGYLVDPDPAVTRAGLVADLARPLGLRKIDERIAFLTADEPVHTEFGRTLRVEASLPWSRKRLRAAVRAAGTARWTSASAARRWTSTNCTGTWTCPVTVA